MEFSYNPLAVSSIININISVIYLSQLMYQYQYIIINWIPQFIYTSWVLPNFLFLFQDLIQGITLYLSGLFRFLLSVTVSHSYLFSLVIYFVEWPFIGICLTFFSWLDWGYSILGGKGMVPLLLYHTEGVCYQHELSLVDINLNPLAEVACVRFLYFRIIIFPLIMLYLYIRLTLFEGKSLCAAPNDLRCGEQWSISLRRSIYINCLEDVIHLLVFPVASLTYERKKKNKKNLDFIFVEKM